MATNNPIKTDGIVDFTGGMDSYSSPSLLAKNQYTYSINCQIKPGSSGISTRPGYRGVKLKFANKKDAAFFKSAAIQGNGYYIYKGVIFLLVSAEGRLFEFREVNKQEFVVNRLDLENNPNNRHAYFTRVPQGAIINDGESAPITARDRSYNRVSGKNTIGAGRAGVYIQNRFFYISPDRKIIRFSSINNSVSLEESVRSNLLGFYTPDDSDIVAIGEQKFIRKDSNGGSLVFSTQNNLYSVPVNGPVSLWGDPNSDFGKVSGDVYDVSAVSPFSFASLNGNAYFRSRNLGIASLQYLQYIFNNIDIIEPQSYGGHLFFNNDDDYLLDSCYTVKYKNRIYTTVAPNLQKDKVFWSGLIVSTPGQKGILRYDSLYTGIRPWCLQSVKDGIGGEFLYILSKDHDGENRLYLLDETLDYDVRDNKSISEIESQFATRFFNYDNPFSLKNSSLQSIALSVSSSKLNYCIYSRHGENENFKTLVPNGLVLSPNCRTDKDGSFINVVATNQSRVLPYADALGSDNKFYENQDLLKFTGSFYLKRLLRSVELHLPETAAATPDKDIKQIDYNHKKFYSYKLNP